MQIRHCQLNMKICRTLKINTCCITIAVYKRNLIIFYHATSSYTLFVWVRTLPLLPLRPLHFGPFFGKHTLAPRQDLSTLVKIGNSKRCLSPCQNNQVNNNSDHFLGHTIQQRQSVRRQRQSGNGHKTPNSIYHIWSNIDTLIQSIEKSINSMVGNTL